MTVSELDERLAELSGSLVALGEQQGKPCPDPVNAAMIRNWTQAVGDGGDWSAVAPPAMIQVWSMLGLGMPKGGSAGDAALRLVEEYGYTGVVAVNCEQVYDRYIKVGEELHSTMRFGEAVGPKRTGLGEGYFITWYQAWYDAAGERVAEMLFRVLKFKPRARRSTASSSGKFLMPPAIGQDSQFFWDGVRDGELRIQKCGACGVLRHPPGPMCPSCHSTDRTYAVASGRGTVHSYVVHHHPPVPGRTAPFAVALVELEEGVRMVGNVLDVPPSEVTIGMPVEVTFQAMDDEVTLPQWRPAGLPPAQVPAVPEPAAEEPGFPPLEIALTPTFIISTALATRDFTPVHHDTELARAQGSKDIFLNILTTMGLVQRYVLEQVPGAVLAGMKVRLGAPAYAGDTMTITGRRVDAETVEVRGAVGLGDHVTATVRLVPGEGA